MPGNYYTSNASSPATPEQVGETETAKLEVHFIGNPRPEVGFILTITIAMTTTNF